MPLKLIRGSASAPNMDNALHELCSLQCTILFTAAVTPFATNVRETKASQFATPVGLRMYLSRTAAGTLAGHVLPAGLFHAAHHHRHTSLPPTAEYQY